MAPVHAARMKRFMLTLTLLVTACSGGVQADMPLPALPQRAGVDSIVAARAEGVRLLADGEHFHLRFYDATITLQLDGGDIQRFPRPEPRYPRWNGELYETANAQHRLRVAVRRDRPCPSESGLHRVEVRIDEQEFAGCGRIL